MQGSAPASGRGWKIRVLSRRSAPAITRLDRTGGSASKLLFLPAVHPRPVVPPPSPSPPSAQDEQDSDFLRGRRRSWARLIARTWREDPSLCNSCGQPMKIIAALSSPHQDDVIERVLRYLHLWPSGRFAVRNAFGPGPRRATAARFPLGSGHFAARQLAAQPPWKRSPKARAPPAKTQGTAVPSERRTPVDPRETTDPVIEDDLYLMDDIPPDVDA